MRLNKARIKRQYFLELYNSKVKTVLMAIIKRNIKLLDCLVDII